MTTSAINSKIITLNVNGNNFLTNPPSICRILSVVYLFHELKEERKGLDGAGLRVDLYLADPQENVNNSSVVSTLAGRYLI
jgi:hypothetical protein